MPIQELHWNISSHMFPYVDGTTSQLDPAPFAKFNPEERMVASGGHGAMKNDANPSECMFIDPSPAFSLKDLSPFIWEEDP